jgi:hypothetical protein
VEARLNPSNRFNTTLRVFDVANLNTAMASAELSCALARQLHPNTACGGSINPGEWGNLKITLHLKNKKVYEILNALVAQNGRAVWIPLAWPPGPAYDPLTIWHVYPLDPVMESSVLERLQVLEH